MSNQPERKTIRLQKFDYNEAFRVFLTICTKEKRCMLARIVGTGVPDGPQFVKQSEIRVELKEAGRIVQQTIIQLDSFYEHVTVDEYVIMPNHVHLLISFFEKNSLNPKSGPSRTPVPTKSSTQNSEMSKFVSTFKRFCNKAYGENIWQARSYDHVIRDFDDMQRHINYIINNPLKWKTDRLYSVD